MNPASLISPSWVGVEALRPALCAWFPGALTGWTVLAAGWLAVNLLFALWIGGRRRLWERGVQRGADGVLADAAPFTVGHGDVALLLVHGFADTPAVFRELAGALAAQGLTCRAMRVPGAGEPLAAAARQSPATWIEAVRTEAAALRATHREVWILGHSMGGALALLAQLDAPATADGLILLAPLIAVSSARAPLLPPRFWFRLARVALPLARILESCFPMDSLTRNGAAAGYTRDRFFPLATYVGLFALSDRLRGRGADLHVPVFAELVTRDRIVDTAAARAWLAGCPGSRRHLAILDGCGHALPQETRLAPGLARRIAGFIGAVHAGHP
jgi:alpha-beta hydrolase superfamily lysophospholipase